MAQMYEHYLFKSVDNFDLSINMSDNQNANFIDQTFHTPSFGDEEFEIPPLNLPQNPSSNTSNVSYANQTTQQSMGISSPGIMSNSSSQSPPVGLMDTTTPQYGAPPRPQPAPAPSQEMYVPQQMTSPPMMTSQPMQLPSYNAPHTTYSHTMQQQQNVQMAQHPQMRMMSPSQHQSQHLHTLTPMSHNASQHNQMMGSPSPMLTTISQSQLSSHLGMQLGMGGHGPGSMSSGSPGSNHTSPGQETSEDSDDSTPLSQLMGGMKRPSPEPSDFSSSIPKVVTPKKPKVQKKKKKRDPNEPQKPVSAYALFFRDTQAAIKGQNPNASFGEVSKIVASMWDSLDVEHKNVYKKKTETAKKEYLKALAAYRASLVSKAAADQSDNVYVCTSGISPSGLTTINTSSPPSGQPQQLSPLQKKSPLLTSLMEGGCQPTNNMQTMIQPQSAVIAGQVWHMHPVTTSSGMMNSMHQSPPHVTQPMMQQGNMQSSVMMSPMGTRPQMVQMQQSVQQGNSPNYQQNYMQQQQHSGNNNMSMSNPGMMTQEMMHNGNGPQACLRNGCSNPPIESPEWDKEYCSSECVVSHCRDVFTAWVASRQTSNSYAVK